MKKTSWLSSRKKHFGKLSFRLYKTVKQSDVFKLMQKLIPERFMSKPQIKFKVQDPKKQTSAS